MTNEELRENLLMSPKNGYTKLSDQQRVEMESYCKRYSAFMDACKTEREATAWAVKVAEENGFKALVPGMALTNAMREIMAGDIFSGLYRTAEVILIATAIALGTALPMVLGRLL